MPWCEHCSRFWNPPSMNRDGSCPNCGRVIAPPMRAPWHFRLLVVATVLYLGWRAWQGLVLAQDHGVLPIVVGVLAAAALSVWYVVRRARSRDRGRDRAV